MSAHDARGQRRQAELVAAGVSLLAESGWEGVTHRAVAARAKANPGLVHYYFKGTAGLRLAVAAQASHESIAAMFDELLYARDEAALFHRLRRALAAARDDRRAGRVTMALVSATFDDPDIAAAVRDEFARGRVRLERWLGRRHASWPPERVRGTAAVLIAAIDGLMLHLLLDPSLPVEDIDQVLQRVAHQMNDESDQHDDRGTAT